MQIDPNLIIIGIVLFVVLLALALLARTWLVGSAGTVEDAPTDSIRRVALGLIGGFVAVSIGLVYWQVIRAAELTDRPDNIRRIRAMRRNRRGAILDRRGRPLVTSEVSDNGLVKRIYHYPMLSPVTGYYSFRYGQTGIEGALDDYLTGRFAADPLDPFRQRLLRETPVGADVTLTIDLDLQRVAVNALAGNPGAVVLMEVKTGAILALASVPFFDPNELVLDPNQDQEEQAGLVERYWTALNADPSLPLLNRATQGLYTPGSIFKTVTLVAALDRGLVRPDTTFQFEMRPPDRQHTSAWHQNRWTDCQNHDQARFDLAQSYAYSCNVVYADLGVEMGYQTYSEYARRFGLDSAIPLEIESSVSQVAASDDFFDGPEAAYAIASTAFGQGQLLSTPLQAVLLAVAPGNRGVLSKPHLVSKITAADGQIVQETRPEQWRAVMSPDVAARTLECLVVSVQQGWARVIALPDVAMAGKTGTAEVVGDNAKNPHAWFIACAPAEDPRFAVAVIREFAGGGATYAGPIAKAVLQAALTSR
ncbi:MAG TPA: penicillin-binding transpeptidase domain-containing protein [Dehalococcoidia bacterium]|nr:penicillin-binding transpeptidase domain-containing protein [Dehalococcoidia bacterium]